jgi:hypothetical protein
MGILITMTPKTPGVGRPKRGDFVVTLKTRNGGYCLFVASCEKHHGRSYLRHTGDISEAKRYSQAEAESIVAQVKEEHRCTGRVERADRSQV